MDTFIVIKYGIIFDVTLPNSGEISMLGKKIVSYGWCTTQNFM